MTPSSEGASNIEASALADLDAVSDAEQLEGWRLKYLGRKGRLTRVLRSLADLELVDRRKLGAEANRVKMRLEAALGEKRNRLEQARLARLIEGERLDVTLPGYPLPRGGLHPITQILRDVLRAFETMGFSVVEGPEIEWDYYNFEALRIPADHPARDMWDTLWIDHEGVGGRSMLLRTHTSPNQIRIMERSQPPIRVVVPGKCYRFEATDPTHEWMMTQVEGLAVDDGITMSDLKGTLADFARGIFGSDRKVAFRCDYFPFVEPGMELRIDCFICRGAGCRTCARTGWIEILGAGMVHPEIIANAGYDPDRYTGFAFGMGIERIAMLRHGVDDIRHFYTNDLRFLRQF
jgi:phenylalanyl-tRNA synthetase alpha chain